MKKVSLNLGRFTCRLTHPRTTSSLIFISLSSGVIWFGCQSPVFTLLGVKKHRSTLILQSGDYWYIIATGTLGLSVHDLYKQRKMKRPLQINYYLNKLSLKNTCSCSEREEWRERFYFHRSKYLHTWQKPICCKSCFEKQKHLLSSFQGRC